jgi:hypothetical protein
MVRLLRPHERALEVLEHELDFVPSAEGDGGRLVAAPGPLAHRTARTFALDVIGAGDGDLDREQLCFVARVLFLQLVDELQELGLGAIAELAGPQVVALLSEVGSQRGDVEAVVGAMERHLADAAVGQILGEGANQCQHREVSG